jgi:hypothetical protein
MEISSSPVVKMKQMNNGISRLLLQCDSITLKVPLKKMKAASSHRLSSQASPTELKKTPPKESPEKTIISDDLDVPKGQRSDRKVKNQIFARRLQKMYE